MKGQIGWAAAGLLLWAGALWLAPPRLNTIEQLGAALARPVSLPFLWRALAAAQRTGSAAEAFAAGRAILALLPQWTDGHLVFAYRFVLDGEELIGGDPVARAAERLQAALAFLNQAREQNPSRAIDLLVGTSFLIELAARQHPGIGAHLGRGAEAEPAVLADRYLVEAERLGAGATVREMRVFAVPGLIAGLLRAGATGSAVAVLDEALRRIPEVRDQELATAWAATLRRLRLRLLGDREVPLEELATDPRLEPLIPLLRDR